MPELPEVQTTVNGIRAHARGAVITDVWTDYKSPFHTGKDNIKDPKFFRLFRKRVVGSCICDASRRAKNVLIHLSNGYTIIVHMKMTGHFLHGIYEKKKEGGKEVWVAQNPGPLRDDPFNRHIRLVFSLDTGAHLALSDMRRFAKVTVEKSAHLHLSDHLSGSGPEPLDESFDYHSFATRLLHYPARAIKQTLMDHTVIAGIGNIYSDEILWHAGIHPLEKVGSISPAKLRLAYTAMKQLLRDGINFGGDSMSDYRNILGEKGAFQGRHMAYQRVGERCARKACRGTIARIRVGGRSAHFCTVHQKKR